MDTLKILEELKNAGAINLQAFKTYKGQIKHGAETACIIGLKRKRLINDKGEIIYGKNDTGRTGRKDFTRG